jgi:hypothetical protein
MMEMCPVSKTLCFKKHKVMDNVQVNSHIYYMNNFHIIMK